MKLVVFAVFRLKPAFFHMLRSRSVFIPFMVLYVHRLILFFFFF
jgi:hypothetical protein